MSDDKENIPQLIEDAAQAALKAELTPPQPDKPAAKKAPAKPTTGRRGKLVEIESEAVDKASTSAKTFKVKLKGTDAETAKVKKVIKRRAGKPVVQPDDREDNLGKLQIDRYLAVMTPLQIELLKMQNHVKENGDRILAIFEGRDAAGKGGTIKRFIEHLNPRGAHVVALEKPTDRERSQWYFQRYVTHLPAGGEITLFDRSWYNRAMVERVMHFATKEEIKEFLRSVPEFERTLIRSGMKMFKFYFSVSKEVQRARFESRTDDPLKQWKLSPVDRESQGLWDDYTQAKEDMFFYTSTADAPWTIIKSDDKKRARINTIRYFLSNIDYPDRNLDLIRYDRRIIRTVQEELGVED
ncbi:polyphosphate kinase 2 [Magnetospira thiophila]